MRLAVLGTKTTCLRLLEALGDRVTGIVTIDDSADSRSRRSDIVDHGRVREVPTTVAATTAEAYAAVLASSPDAVFVAGWYHLIPSDILDVPAEGFFGVHYSALPAYRGSSPLVWALINGEPRVGFSLFRFTEGMDEGPLAAQGTTDVGPHDDIATVLERLDRLSVDACVRLADDLAAGTHILTEQPTAGASYAGARRPEDGRIDWSWSADRVVRFIRAQSRPYPGAFSVLDGREVRVWSAEHFPDPCFGVPGQVLLVVEGDPVVACGDGTGVRLTETEADAPLRLSLVRSRFDERQGAR